jgi:hypothetical protein
MEQTETLHQGRREGHGSAPRPSIIDIARAALEEAEGHEGRGTEIMRNTVLEDISYVDELCSLIIHRVKKDVFHTDHSTARRHAESTTEPMPTKNGATPEAAAALANVIARSAMGFKLPRGMMLRDATADDIYKAIEQYRKQAVTMMTNVRWLESIAARLKPGEKVGDVLDEKTVRELREAAIDAFK